MKFKDEHPSYQGYENNESTGNSFEYLKRLVIVLLFEIPRAVGGENTN